MELGESTANSVGATRSQARRESSGHAHGLHSGTLLLLLFLLPIRAASGGDSPAGSGMDATTKALRELADGDAAVRKTAATALGRAWPEGAIAVPVLVAALSDEDTGVRVAAQGALEELGAKGSDAAVAFVATSLTSEDPTGYGASLLVAAMLGSGVTPSDVAHWILQDSWGGALAASLLDFSPPDERRPPYAAWLCLLDLARGLVPGTQDARVVGLARAALAVLGSAALAVSAEREAPKGALDLLRHAEPIVRWSGARLLARRGSRRPEVLDALRAAASNTTDSTWVTVDSPGRSHEFAAKAATAALERLQTPAPPPKEAAPIDPAEVARRARVAADEKAPLSERRRAIDSLSGVGAAAAAAVPALTDLLRRIAETGAAEPKTETGGPFDSLRALETRGAEFLGPWELRLLLLDALGAIGKGAAPALPALQSPASEDPLVRYLAARAIRKIKSP